MASFTLEMTEECGGCDTETIDADDAESAAEAACERLREWVKDGEWGEDGASVSAHWSLTDEDGEDVDDGSITVEIEPDHDALIRAAGGDTDCDHDWTSDGDGGCTENPGVWSHGGTAMTFASHCRTCGLHRVEHSTGSQQNPGEHDTVEYSQPNSWCAGCEHVKCECGD